MDKDFVNELNNNLELLDMLHPRESIKAGQVYQFDEMTFEILKVNSDGSFRIKTNGFSLVPNGYEFETPYAPNKAWKLVGESKVEEPDVQPDSKTLQGVSYLIVERGMEVTIDDLLSGAVVSNYDTKEEAFEDVDPLYNEKVVKATIKITLEDAPEDKPSFESELEALKKKYGKE